MKAADLGKKYYIFGNREDVWMDNVHISSTGRSTTLCGRPMLSRNHADFQKIEEANCKDCVSIHNQDIKTE